MAEREPTEPPATGGKKRKGTDGNQEEPNLKLQTLKPPEVSNDTKSFSAGVGGGVGVPTAEPAQFRIRPGTGQLFVFRRQISQMFVQIGEF